LVYIDDILLGSRPPGDHSKEERVKIHYRFVFRVLEVFRKHRLFVKGEKFRFFYMYTQIKVPNIQNLIKTDLNMTIRNM
jgi:hypothetical protein